MDNVYNKVTEVESKYNNIPSYGVQKMNENEKSDDSIDLDDWIVLSDDNGNINNQINNIYNQINQINQINQSVKSDQINQIDQVNQVNQINNQPISHNNLNNNPSKEVLYRGYNGPITDMKEDEEKEEEENEREEEIKTKTQNPIQYPNIMNNPNKLPFSYLMNQSKLSPSSSVISSTIPLKPTKKISFYEIINKDPSLLNFESFIKNKVEHFHKQLKEIEKNEGSLESFSKSYENMGVHCSPNGVITYREYAPGAKGVSLYGDFNKWNKEEHWAIKNPYGCWELKIASKTGNPLIQHGQKVKCNVVLENGNWVDRNPIWSTYLLQDKKSFRYDYIHWDPENKYKWQSQEIHIKKPKSLRIYEAHIGMSSNEEKVSTYKEFAINILPRIKKLGYTAIQLMAIMEHADYASFGFQVNNIFAISSRFGTPEDLMYLIDVAHSMGLYVIMDLIHSSASSNVDDGFNYWDGTDYLYFHGGNRGTTWGKRLYNYSSYETLRLLLSNIAFYSNEYHIDGFRFDDIVSILFKNHGYDCNFTGDYREYFNENFDEDGAVYLMLANYLIHKINPESITIAEDFSGIPGLSSPINEGGFGFDYRLNMKIDKKWVELIQDYKDEDWNMGNIIYTLTNRRYDEKYISYCESHDQSGNFAKSLSMWLFGKEIYFNMSDSKPETIVINRGMNLHKMIRMLTFALGGEAYLNFMGNEFGHPEWIEFPKKENGFSYSHCCRKWELCDNKLLRFKYLYNWDVAMNKLEEIFYFISSPYQYVSTKHEKDKIIVFEKGDLLFVFNFHPEKSFESYRIGTKWASQHRIILDSDEKIFFGKERLNYGHGHRFPCHKVPFNKRPYNLTLYVPSRTCIVLIAKEN